MTPMSLKKTIHSVRLASCGISTFILELFKSTPQEQIEDAKPSAQGIIFPEDVKSDLNIEANRLKTFEKWHVSFVDIHQLALLGFYYYGPDDMVKCYFCSVEIGRWEEGDDVLTDHMRWSPTCNLMCRNETDNVPISEVLLNQTLPPVSTQDVYGSVKISNTVSEGSIDTLSEDDVSMYHHQLFGQCGITAMLRGGLSWPIPQESKLSKPEHPEYYTEALRFKSYTDWPKTMHQKPQQLCDAGFYYTGRGDRVRCFCCGGVLKDWEENDDPWEQHAVWYVKCAYVKLMKGEEFINKMASQREQIVKGMNKDIPAYSSQSSQTSTLEETCCEKVQESLPKPLVKDGNEGSKLCKICYSNEYNAIFLPCGHVMACTKCAASVSKCPACRQRFDNVIRVYFF